MPINYPDDFAGDGLRNCLHLCLIAPPCQRALPTRQRPFEGFRS